MCMMGAGLVPPKLKLILVARVQNSEMHLSEVKKITSVCSTHHRRCEVEKKERALQGASQHSMLRDVLASPRELITRLQMALGRTLLSNTVLQTCPAPLRSIVRKHTLSLLQTLESYLAATSHKLRSARNTRLTMLPYCKANNLIL